MIQNRWIKGALTGFALSLIPKESIAQLMHVPLKDRDSLKIETFDHLSASISADVFIQPSKAAPQKTPSHKLDIDHSVHTVKYTPAYAKTLRVYALAVAINEYPDLLKSDTTESKGQLHESINDGNKFLRYFWNSYGLHRKGEDTMVMVDSLYDGKVTKEIVLKRLRAIQGLNLFDEVWVYFSGHGGTEGLKMHSDSIPSLV